MLWTMQSVSGKIYGTCEAKDAEKAEQMILDHFRFYHSTEPVNNYFVRLARKSERAGCFRYGECNHIPGVI